MGERYSKSDAEKALQRLCEVIGAEYAPHYRKLEPGEVSTYGSDSYTTNPGAWALDYNPTYGGCIVEAIAEDGGTYITHPLGEGRKSPREFCEAVHFAIRAMQVKEAGKWK